MRKIQWREVFKFLSGATTVGGFVNLYLAWHQIALPFFGFTLSPAFLQIRGIVGLVLAVVFFYLGWVRKG
jgi:hypothetical protein